MPGRGATTFEKRQKEQNRKEKRQDKLARRLQRKQDTTDRPGGGPPIEGVDDDTSLDRPSESA
jgi:hypothetical protein